MIRSGYFKIWMDLNFYTSNTQETFISFNVTNIKLLQKYHNNFLIYHKIKY